VPGADAGYAARVIGCIRPHIAFAVPEGTSAAVYADFRVELWPDGSVAGVRLLRPSALANYDAAAERAIRRCDPFPRKRDGSIDRTIDVRMYPAEAR
jgi:colicin import membrane protein